MEIFLKKWKSVEKVEGGLQSFAVNIFVVKDVLLD